MADVINKNTGVAIEIEVTEGTYVAPSAASSFISPLEDGINEITIQAKEVLERTNVTANLDKEAGRGGIKSCNGTIPIEFKAGDSLAVPEYGVLLQSALGATDAGVSAAASGTGNTASSIKFANTSAYTAGDIVKINESGKHHVSPISSVVTNTSIELLVAIPTGAPSDNVTVTKLVDYRTADSGHPSFSLTKYNTGSDIETSATTETAAGCKVGTFSIDAWTTGQYITSSFAYEGLSYTRVVGTSSYTPSYDTSKPVVALSACIYKDGTSIPMDAFTLSLENTLTFKTSTCSENGRVASRVSARNITGSVTPYKADNSVAEFTTWNNDTTFSIFGYAYNPTAVSGEFEEIVAFYVPVAQYGELTQSDKDGLAQNSITFSGRNHATLPTMIVAFG
jgi:hypothetical protein